MKRNISIALALAAVLACVFSGGCGKKHVIDTSHDSGDLALATGTDAIVYENLTDADGKAVTDAGETVTDAGKTESAAETASAESNETTAAAPGEPTTKTENASGGADQNETAPALAAPTTAPDVSVAEGDYVFSLSADRTKVKAGDTVAVTLRLKNCRNVACFDLIVKAEGPVSVSKYKSNTFANAKGDKFDIYSNSTPDGVLFGGMITTACDFLDDDLCKITYQVEKTAKAGDRITVKAAASTFLVSSSSDGMDTKDYGGAIAEAVLTLTVS